jgi:putative spermidine/putrescine transport system ATP-binding protein
VPSIFITHDQEEALELADRIAVLNKGRIDQIGTPFEVYNQPKTEHVATFLGAANIMEGKVQDGKFVAECGAELDIDKDVRAREGETVKMVFRPEDVFLRVAENLRQPYTKLCDGVVDAVSFVGSFERVGVRVDVPGVETIFVTRPKSETAVFPLHAGQSVPVGVVRYRILDAVRS